MSEGLQIARAEVEQLMPYYGSADNPRLIVILKELINCCEQQERVIADMSVRIDELNKKTRGIIF